MAFAVSAVVAAVAAPTIASVAAAVAAVGVATSVVGAVTGHQNLVKIGGELGLIGGVTGLANSAFTSLAADGVASGVAADGASEGTLYGASTDGATSAGGAAAGTGGISGASGGMDSVVIPQDAGTLSISSGAPSVQTSMSPAVTGAPSSGATSGLSGTTIGTDASGMYNTPQMMAGSTSPDLATYETGALAPSTVATPADSPLDSIKRSLGDGWAKLSPQAQAEIMKSALSIPGGIQSQKNTEAALAMQQQRINQTSHGNEVPTFGIIQKAMKG